MRLRLRLKRVTREVFINPIKDSWFTNSSEGIISFSLHFPELCPVDYSKGFSYEITG
jgi:hypothetical protein